MGDSQNSAANSLPQTFARAAGPSEVGLFIPPHEDSSNRVAFELVKKLVHETPAINLRLFLTAQKPDPRVDNTPELCEKSFCHSRILRDVVFPFQRENGLKAFPDGVLLAPDLLAEKYKGRVFIETVADLNDPQFIQDRIIGNPALRMAFSVRNLGKFGQPIIDAFNQYKGEATLINSHPAVLPGIRGLEGPFWTRFLDGYNEYTTTLHVIEMKFDAGPVLDYHARAVNGDAKKPVMQFIRDAAPEVAEMIYNQVHLRMIRNGHHRGLKLQEGDVGYRTLPTREEIKQAKAKGIIFTDPHEQIRWLTRHYSKGKLSRELSSRLNTAYSEFKSKMDDDFNLSHSFFLVRALSLRDTGLDRPVLLIPRGEEGEPPGFQALKTAIESAGFEVFCADLSKLESLSKLKDPEILKHIFERPHAQAIDQDLATFVHLLSLIDRDVVVSLSALPDDIDQAARRTVNRILLKLQAVQAHKNENLDNDIKPVFTQIPVEQDTAFSQENLTPEAIEAFVKNAHGALAKAKAERQEAPAPGQTTQAEIPEAFKQALG